MKKEIKTEKILLRVTPSSKAWLKSKADKDDRSVNSIINKIIEETKKGEQ
jgi:predicted HicB family RNase H-like nuclease